MSKPDLSDPVTLRIPLTILADIEAVADTCERTRSWVMVRALRQYMAAEGAEILSVKRGREQVVAGDVHDFDDVLREIDVILKTKVA